MRWIEDTVRLAAAATLGLMAAGTSAQTFKTPPLPGLWEEDFKILVNGQDLMASLAQAQEAMMKNMSPQQRAQMQAMMAQQGASPGKQRECLTPKDAAELADPRKAIAESMKDQPECRTEVVSITGQTVKVKGRCESAEGYTGDFTGEYTLVDAKNWTYAMQGKGTMATRMPGAGPKAGGPVEMNMRGQGRWISADCGSVKPSR
jgi:Protein of unknown function (DUF3617)